VLDILDGFLSVTEFRAMLLLKFGRTFKELYTFLSRPLLALIFPLLCAALYCSDNSLDIFVTTVLKMVCSTYIRPRCL